MINKPVGSHNAMTINFAKILAECGVTECGGDGFTIFAVDHRANVVCIDNIRIYIFSGEDIYVAFNPMV